MSNEYYRLHIIGTGMIVLYPSDMPAWIMCVWLLGAGVLLWGMRADTLPLT